MRKRIALILLLGLASGVLAQSGVSTQIAQPSAPSDRPSTTPPQSSQRSWASSQARAVTPRAPARHAGEESRPRG